MAEEFGRLKEAFNFYRIFKTYNKMRRFFETDASLVALGSALKQLNAGNIKVFRLLF